MYSKSLSRQLILGELFDLTLYRRLARHATGDTHTMVEELIRIEEKHVEFWQNFFQERITDLGLRRRWQMLVLAGSARIFGEHAIHLILEAREVYAIRKYLEVWERYKREALGEAVRGVLADEFKHEDEIVSRLHERRINPENVRNVFLGFNDGLVELVGAVSGFLAAFGDIRLVLIAGFTTAVAGSFSMAAGSFGAISSEKEIRRLSQGKAEFLGSSAGSPPGDTAAKSAVLVGISYLMGSMVPIVPVVLGARSVFLPLVAAGFVIVIVSFVVAFLTGMEVRKRITINLGVIVVAIALTYAIGLLARRVLG